MFNSWVLDSHLKLNPYKCKYMIIGCRPRKNQVLHPHLTLVRPHTENASSVWDTHLQKDKTSLEDIQKFAMRMCAKQWDLGNQDLLELFQLPSLGNRRLHIRLCTMYKIIYDLCYFPPIIVPKPPSTFRHSHPLTFMQPYARTNALFIPNTVRTCME